MKQSSKLFTTRDLTTTALLAAIICILGPIAIPLSFSPVPISLCTLGIYFALAVSNFKVGVTSVILYVLLGLVGVPVFANYTAGVGKLAGPTGGYIIGYIFMAIIYALFLRFGGNSLVLQIIGMVLGTLVCYGFGTYWLAKQLDMTFVAGLSVGVIPYIPGDIVKLIIALAIALPLRKRLSVMYLDR